MAKGQMRSTKEQRKKKSNEGKKNELPRYMRGSDTSAIGKVTTARPDQKK